MTDAGVNAPPAIFEHDGEQYVAVLSAGNLLAGSKRGDSYGFGLESAEPISNRNRPDNHPFIPAEGVALCGQNCVFCHGRRVRRAYRPLEGLAEFSTDYVTNIVSTGLNEMPSFGDLLSNSEIRLIADM